MLPTRISLTGADDAVSPEVLAALSHEYPAVEWALLYFPEKEGSPRNPSAAWRAAFQKACPHAQSAAHLCGERVFRQLLDPTTAPEVLANLAQYDRIQVNINARVPLFSDSEVFDVYCTLLNAGQTLILQYHPESVAVIEHFLGAISVADRTRVHLLFDASKGRGKRPDLWPRALTFLGKPLFCGYAGGLCPEGLPDVLPAIEGAAGPRPYWIDMETGLRTNNQFDIGKALQILTLASA